MLEGEKHQTVKYHEAIRLALHEQLRIDPSVVVMGLGVPDPGGVFGTTKDLQEEFGINRVMDIPCAENGMTGVAIGMALGGKKVVLSHQRVDFSLLSLEQILNQASKWHFMFGGQESVPIVIRMIIGRGWGQGPQHSQFPPSIFTHFPGLKVMAPVFARDANSMLMEAIQDPNPVIFFEHRWLHFVQGQIAPSNETDNLKNKAALLHQGNQCTLVSYSYSVLECLEASKILRKQGIECDVIDLRYLNPIDYDTIFDSVKKTRHLVVLEHTWGNSSVASEIITQVATNGIVLDKSPVRMSLPDYPLPTSVSLSEKYYSGVNDVLDCVAQLLEIPNVVIPKRDEKHEKDKPHMHFNGAF